MLFVLYTSLPSLLDFDVISLLSRFTEDVLWTLRSDNRNVYENVARK